MCSYVFYIESLDYKHSGLMRRALMCNRMTDYIHFQLKTRRYVAFHHVLFLGSKCHANVNSGPLSNLFYMGLSMTQNRGESWVHVMEVPACFLQN